VSHLPLSKPASFRAAKGAARIRTCFKIGGAVRCVHGPSWATRDGEAHAGGTCEPSRGDPAQCPGTHPGVPIFLKHVLRVDVWRQPHASLFAQGVRFALTGCVVSAVYLLTTSVLALVAGLPFQAALVIGFTAGVAVHFSMQRLFVWTDHEDFALAFPGQVGRYLLASATQYGVTAVSTLIIPSALGLPTVFVYLTTALLMTSLNFLLFRNYIFHSKPVTLSAKAEEST